MYVFTNLQEKKKKKNSWLKISTVCHIHTQSTANHIPTLPGKCQSSFPLYSCYGYFSIKRDREGGGVLNSCSHSIIIQTEVSILLGCDMASLGDWFPVFYDNDVAVSSSMVKMSECHSSWSFQPLQHYNISQCLEPTTQYCSIRSKRNEHPKYTAAKI